MRNLCDECNKRDVCRMRDNGVATCLAFTPADKDSRKAFNNGYRCCEEYIEKIKDEVEAEYKSILCNEAYSDITYGLKIALDIIEYYARGEDE